MNAHSLPLALIACFLVVLSSLSAQETPEGAMPLQVALRVDAGKPAGELRPIWRFFGADEPNYAYMKDGARLLGELGALRPGEVYFRTHNLLTTGDGTPALKWGSTNAYREDEQGRAIYDWMIVDRIFGAYLDRGVRPYVQIGFMPQALSIKPVPYQHAWTPKARYDEIYTGWAFPPKDYAKWAALVHEWAKHCVEKYGPEEVARWYWQTWNEPNIGYWRGTETEFRKLNDFAIDAVRRALPSARVGGPDVAGGPGGKYLEGFLEHCLRGTNHATGMVGTPLDFISFHAKGQPKFVDGHVQMGIANQLRDIDRAFAVIKRFPELKQKPIVIGESDPDGCAACQGPQLGYRNTTMYSSYTAASFARKHELAARHGVNLEGALTWAFTFEDQPLFAGFRQLASGGLNLPVLNVFRMFSRMSGQQLAVESDGAIPLDAVLKSGVRAAPDISALACLDARKLSVMVWHYHDDDLPGPPSNVTLSLAALPLKNAAAKLRHFRVDAHHSNVFEAWKRLGSPAVPSTEQYLQLEKAGRLEDLEPARQVAIVDHNAALSFSLPRHGVSLLELEW